MLRVRQVRHVESSEACGGADFFHLLPRRSGCRVLGYAGTVIRLPQSPHQQTVKGFSLSLWLFNLLQCLRSLCILLTLLDISARLPCRQSHLPWTQFRTRNWKVDREEWQPGHEGEWIVSSIHQLESDYTQWAHYQGRKLSYLGVMMVVTCDEWPVTCDDMSPGCHLNVTDRWHQPLSDEAQSPVLTPERQPSTVSWCRVQGWEWLHREHIPSELRTQAARPVTGSLEQPVVAKLSLLSFVCFAGAWPITPPYTHSANFLQILRIQPITPLTTPLMDFNFSSKWISFSSELAWVSCWCWMMPTNSTHFVEKMGLLHCSLHCNFNTFSSPKCSTRVFG